MKGLFLFLLIPIIVIFSTTNKSDKNTQTPNLENQFAVVQLFTSQGCSSCPSADKLLDEVKADYKAKNVVVLSYHVDYWNRLGWKDPFSSKEFTQLQYAYSDKFKDQSVYTPEAVINGKIHFVGSSEDKMTSNLSKSLNDKAENSVLISNIQKVGNQINFEYKVVGNSTDKNLQIALVINNRKTEIKRGENGGRTLNSSNIVVNELSIKLNNEIGKAAIQIPEVVENKDILNIVGFVQKSDLTITGATESKV